MDWHNTWNTDNHLPTSQHWVTNTMRVVGLLLFISGVVLAFVDGTLFGLLYVIWGTMAILGSVAAALMLDAVLYIARVARQAKNDWTDELRKARERASRKN